jgi:hypothetical protein
MNSQTRYIALHPAPSHRKQVLFLASFFLLDGAKTSTIKQKKIKRTKEKNRKRKEEKRMKVLSSTNLGPGSSVECVLYRMCSLSSTTWDEGARTISFTRLKNLCFLYKGWVITQPFIITQPFYRKHKLMISLNHSLTKKFTISTHSHARKRNTHAE